MTKAEIIEYLYENNVRGDLSIEQMADDLAEQTEPQTEMEKSGSRAVLTARCLNCHNAKACKENHWEVCRYEPWKLTAVEDEPQTCEECEHWNDTEDGCADRHGCKDEPQTCSFSNCDNFKNPDYERCIECKRKQIKLKTSHRRKGASRYGRVETI